VNPEADLDDAEQAAWLAGYTDAETHLHRQYTDGRNVRAQRAARRDRDYWRTLTATFLAGVLAGILIQHLLTL
jgi:hypothetical protein